MDDPRWKATTYDRDRLVFLVFGLLLLRRRSAVRLLDVRLVAVILVFHVSRLAELLAKGTERLTFASASSSSASVSDFPDCFSSPSLFFSAGSSLSTVSVIFLAWQTHRSKGECRDRLPETAAFRRMKRRVTNLDLVALCLGRTGSGSRVRVLSQSRDHLVLLSRLLESGRLALLLADAPTSDQRSRA